MIRSANKLKELILGTESRCVAIIRADIAGRTPRFITMIKIKKEINRLGDLNSADFKYLFGKMKDIYTRLSLKWRKSPKNDRKIGLDNAALDEFDSVEATKNVLAGRMESRAKIKEIRGFDGVFYVCSVFKDCAKDHLAYQGKLYYAAGWEDRVSDSDRSRIARFIEKKNLMCIDDVCFDYPYLLTRPNCKHRLTSVSIKDALSGNYEPEVSSRELRTPAESKRIREYERKKYNRILKNGK